MIPFFQVAKSRKLSPTQDLSFPARSARSFALGRVGAEKYAREQEDLSQHRVLTKTQFKQRVAQLLSGYGEPAHGQELSYLSKLVRGMPKRLAKCRARKYGRCGK